ncbi:SurA N-terminal domain-containing protein [Gracilibacillus kekensis]|uniref:SurA N-terminal domain-containing protein n=1 Tax=Gracilibacillus kekensis TaxID=1027249 RepID=A0A1M7PYT6_9BACI|nr:SurA N-terminal domain-containing protein [Gracilibacillus kekensis]SHN22895.1 SurA N-terminal domain-containing protein [Gracilibacillus kekensis]
MKRILMLLMMITLAVIIVACGNDDDTAEDNNTEEPASSEENKEETAATDGEEAQTESAKQNTVSDEEIVEEGQAVATINGEEVSAAKYNRVYPLVKNMLQQYGQDVEDLDAVKDQVLNELITQELILQDAKEEGLEVDTEEVESQFTALKEQSGDDFSSVLEDKGFTEESYKSQLENDLLRNQYMESVIGITVTDEEVKEYYKQVKEQSKEEVPALEEVEGTIRQQLTAQKQQEKQEEISAKIEELRENAEIEELI